MQVSFHGETLGVGEMPTAPLAQPLGKCFERSGFKAYAQQYPDMPQDLVRIMVGTKPN